MEVIDLGTGEKSRDPVRFAKKPDAEIAKLPIAGRSIETIPSSAVSGSVKSSFLGPDLKITGSLESHSLVQIEGIIEGDVHARQIIVGPKARVIGNIVADDVTVAGEVDGSVRGTNVKLQSGSRVSGEMHHNSLAIEHGAHFEGHSRRPQDIAELAPKLANRS